MQTHVSYIVDKYKKGLQKDGVYVRLASSLEDAAALSQVIRSAWGLSNGEKPYFYALFNDPNVLYNEVLAPSMNAKKLEEIHCLSLIATVDNYIVGTASMVFDHAHKVVELGRDATLVKYQKKQINKILMQVRSQILQEISDGYCTVSDSTTLSLGIQRNLQTMGLPVVAFHLSSFVIQAENIDRWKEFLSQKFSPEIANALLIRSERSQLGRFATFYHIALSKKTLIRLKCPFIPEFLTPFFDYTCQQINTYPDKTLPQRNRTAKTSTKDNNLTSTRLVVIGSEYADPGTYIAKAKRDIFDTLIVWVPCDKDHLLYHKSLLENGYISAGIFPNTNGEWFTSYVFVIDKKLFLQTQQGLEVLHLSGYKQLTIPSNIPLVELVRNGMERSQYYRNFSNSF